jgi:RNA polymerase sigma-70 factor, ECF subfamily
LTESDFRAAFEEHKTAVFRFAWRMTNSPEIAEDIAQDVFLALWREPSRFDATRGRMRSFLLGIARNLALKHLRRHGDQRNGFDGEHFAAQPLDIEGRELADMVGDAVQALPPLQREVLILAQYEGLSLEEIAGSVEADVGTVKSRLHRARENLRRMLAPLKNGAARSFRL